MKSIQLLLLSAFIGFTTLSNAQNLPVYEKTNKITFLDVVDAEGMPASELYEVVKEWTEEQGDWELTEDESGDKIEYNGRVNVYYPAPQGGDEEGYVNFVYTVFFKDGKYRYVISDFVHEGKGKNPNGGKLEEKTPECGKIKMSGRGWVTIKNETHKKVKDLIESLEDRVTEVRNDPTRVDDW